MKKRHDALSAHAYDLVVIGGGPAGAAGAIAAGLLGRRVALIEKAAEIGGAGINTGTVPSKTLRETALALSGVRSRRLYGVDLSLRREATVADFMRHQGQVTAGERRRIESRLGDTRVDTFFGGAWFIDPHTLRVGGGGTPETVLRGEYILIATGSSPLRPPEFPFNDDRVHDSNGILELKALPRKLAIVGAGVIGSEYAGTFAALGAEVHVIDGRDVLLPFLDSEVSRALEAAMAANGVQFHWNQRVIRCDATRAREVTLTLSSGAELGCDGVLVCAGRSSNTGDLNLAAAGLSPGKRGLAPVDANYRTAVPHIYAAGDVVGPPALAATGMEQARVAVCHAFRSGIKEDIAPVLPTGVYTIPEAAMVGATEEALRSTGVAYVAGRAPYAHNPRGRIIGADVGFLKLLFRADDMRLVGVHVLGELATEVVHVGLIAMLAQGTSDLFNRACFNYPTLGDLYKYATYDALLQRTGISPRVENRGTIECIRRGQPAAMSGLDDGHKRKRKRS
jgi:NAD(P) transhydrogenase